MTVKELKEAIAGIPDDTQIIVDSTYPAEYSGLDGETEEVDAYLAGCNKFYILGFFDM